LKRLSRSDTERILAAIKLLAENPEAKTNVKRLNNHALAIYRLRVGDYRVLYDKDDGLRIIDVIDIGHRKNIY
jgi:mRNA interferase RelE/StbE